MTKAPTPVTIEPAGGSLLGRASFVWAIPLVALLIALGVAWQSYTDRGPLIAIEFENGAGITKRETELRYRDIAVGVVEEVKFSDGLETVIALVRLDKNVAPYVDANASFWVVRPELSARGVSGLDTVLSGVYIEGSWDSDIQQSQDTFTGLIDAPLFRHGKEGLEITLRTTPGGSITDDSSISFRGIEVGRVGTATISEQGSFATAKAIIYHPHSRLISASTRFWDTSGFTFSVGPGGAEIDFSSVATLIGGGLTFDTFVSGTNLVTKGAEFDVYADEKAARNSLFNASEVEALEMRVVFDESVSGLAVDAPVELNGLRIGKVSSVSGVIGQDPTGGSRVMLNAVLSIQPARLGLQDDVTPQAAFEFLAQRINEGLRARLSSAGLLSSGLKIELVQVDDMPSYVVESGAGIVPIIPTTDSNISDATATVEGVVNRISNLPIEELMFSAIQLLNSSEALLSDEDLRETPQDLRALLDEVRTIVASQDVQNIPVTLNATLNRVETLLSQLDEGQMAAKLVTALDAASAAANGITTSVDGVPALVEQLQTIATNAASMPLTELTTQLTALTSSADQILGTPAAKRLPADLGEALKEINATLGALREGGAVTNINATLNSTRKAADAVAIATQDLPTLVTRIQAVLTQASATIDGYNKGDVLSRDAQAALRDISKAADAMASLARMIERNPDSLIKGR